MKYTIVLKSKSISQNKLYGYQAYSWAYATWRRKYQALLGNEPCEYAKCKRKVTIVREYGKFERKYDYGNLVGGMKPLVDALVSYGHLYDDSPVWSDQVYEQRRAKDGVAKILITLEDADDPTS